MSQKNSTGRRGFLKNAVVLGATSFASGSMAETAAKADPNRRLKVGCMVVGEYSFTSWSWSDIIEGISPPNSDNRGNFGTPFLNMDITHVWDPNPDAEPVKNFAKRMNASIVKKYDDMVTKVDGIIMGGFYEVPWQHKLAAPYIKAGVPVYLSRPFANSLRNVDELLDLAAKHGTPILATAKYEHYHEAPALKNRLKHVGKINCVQATCSTRDYPIHFHIQFMIPHIFGYDIESISLITDDLYRNNYLQDTYLYKGWENQPPFPCVINGMSNPDVQFTINVVGTQGTESVKMVRSPHWRDGLFSRYSPQIIAMQRCFYGEMFEPLEDIRKKTEIFLTGYYSHLKNGGGPVKIGTVPVDWSPPVYKPGWIDESIFKD